MTFENTYLMLLYFKSKKKYKSNKTSIKTVNKDADKIMIDLENQIVNQCLINNNNSDETIDNRCYPYNKKNLTVW